MTKEENDDEIFSRSRDESMIRDRPQSARTHLIRINDPDNKQTVIYPLEDGGNEPKEPVRYRKLQKMR